MGNNNIDYIYERLPTKSKPKGYTFSSVTLMLSCCFMAGFDIWCYLGLLNISRWILVVCAVATSFLAVASVIFFFKKSAGWLKTVFVFLILESLLEWGYFLIAQFGILEYLTSTEKLQEALSEVGWWKYLLFFILQFLQVTFIPLPAMATTIAGTLMFGPAMATILSFFGIMFGSIFAFMIGDKCGEKVVKWIVGEKQTRKYSQMLYDKGKYMFFLMMLFPLFPDDILCLVAGMTTMSYRFFLTTIILTRPIGIIMTCYLGSGEIIPFTGWGLAVWAIIVAFMIFAFWFTYHYKDWIEKVLTRMGRFFTKKFGSPRDKAFIYLNINPNQKLLPPPTLPSDEVKKKNKK
ncbi:MAG: TVP38/TMEM64 family protein [Clostridia bacterium]|nr:TVP38/TMEM64 family protein [Clostridia bacterium]